MAKSIGVETRITWLGFVRGKEKAQFLNSIGLLVVPSEYECFGMVAAEAMSEGTPVLVTPETGVAEVIQRNEAGSVVPPTVPTLVAAIADLMQNRSRLTAHSSRGVAAVHDTFSFSAHGKALANLYSELIRGCEIEVRTCGC